jgi:hypothetical protein
MWLFMVVVAFCWEFKDLYCGGLRVFSSLSWQTFCTICCATIEQNGQCFARAKCLIDDISTVLGLKVQSFIFL